MNEISYSEIIEYKIVDVSDNFSVMYLTMKDKRILRFKTKLSAILNIKECLLLTIGKYPIDKYYIVPAMKLDLHCIPSDPEINYEVV